MRKSRAKYIRCEPFRDHEHFRSWIEKGYPIYYNHKFMVPGFLIGMPYRTVIDGVKNGTIAPAVAKPKEMREKDAHQDADSKHASC